MQVSYPSDASAMRVDTKVMCDNSRECDAAKRQGFVRDAAAGPLVPRERAPAAVSVRPGARKQARKKKD
jgi:hypothetical protein